jgi:ElaA protein
MFITKNWKELSRDELHEIFILRQKVFVVEQDCAYLDADGLDPESLHLFKIKEGGALMAYARILPPGLYYKNQAAIGRVVVDPAFRKTGWGKKIMLYAMDRCREHFPGHSIRISAQQYLETFYLDLGFVASGEKYLEDGIPHMAMELFFDA